jgi:hypothetical protein
MASSNCSHAAAVKKSEPTKKTVLTVLLSANPEGVYCGQFDAKLPNAKQAEPIMNSRAIHQVNR